MKLWKKIAVISCAVLVLLFSGIFITVTKQVSRSYLQHTEAQTLDDHGELVLSFLRQYAKEKIDPSTGRTAEIQTQYLFSQLGDESSVLCREGAVLSSHQPFDPQAYMEPETDGATKSLALNVEGIPYLLYGSWISPLGPEDPGFTVYTALDLTDLNEEIRQMALTTAGITGSALLLGLAALVACVYFTMKPLDRFTAAASKIAEGSYGDRTDLSRKDEIGDLSRSFDRMAQAVQQKIETLQEQNQRQKLFIGAVAHEFKTPLTSLLLSADTLQNTCLSEEQQQETVRSMETQCHWLERMVGSMLKLLTLQNTLHREPVALPALMESLREICGEALAQRQVTLEIACDADTMELDRDLMQCALQNLILNAARASEPHQTVQLYIHGTTFEVSDHGKGIPRDCLPRITEPFYRVDKARSRKEGGTGLGLALVKEIVEAHGSTLEIESEEKAGTTVSFTLPKAEEK